MNRDLPQQTIQDASGLALIGDPMQGQPFVRRINVFAIPGDSGPVVGTDPMAGCNAITHNGDAGQMAGYVDLVDAMRSFAKDGIAAAKAHVFDPATPTMQLINDLALRIVWNKQDEVLDAQTTAQAQKARAFFAWIAGGAKVEPQPTTEKADPPQAGTHRLPKLDKVLERCIAVVAARRKADPTFAMPGYMAAPLAGIFATAPYLHNGSVPTLDAMLSPPDARPDRFAIGDVLFDLVKVGLGAVIEGGPNAEFKVTDLRGRIIPGNSNEGHIYPAKPLTEVERAQLILYLKGL